MGNLTPQEAKAAREQVYNVLINHEVSDMRNINNNFEMLPDASADKKALQKTEALQVQTALNKLIANANEHSSVKQPLLEVTGSFNNQTLTEIKKMMSVPTVQAEFNTYMNEKEAKALSRDNAYAEPEKVGNLSPNPSFKTKDSNFIG